MQALGSVALLDLGATRAELRGSEEYRTDRLGGIVRQQAGLDVALDVAVAEERLTKTQQRHRPGHVQLHPERRRREDQARERRGEIVHPGGGNDRTGGRNYCTAMGVLCLAVEYRYLPIYQR